MYPYFSSSDEDDGPEEVFKRKLRRIRRNYRHEIILYGSGDEHYIQRMTDEQWEELGRDISDNDYLRVLKLSRGALNEHKMSIFFRGLTRSISIEEMRLFRNGLSAAGVRSMVPFLQNANNLTCLELSDNNIQSEGFNMQLRALCDSPIKELHCIRCGIESIEIERDNVPKHLESLTLDCNYINADGCRELAKLLEGEDATLKNLSLDHNNIDDQGVNTLVDALQNNRSLTDLSLVNNDGLSKQGQMMLLKLVNDVSSIKATLQSNHTLTHINANSYNLGYQITWRIHFATKINAQNKQNPEAAGRTKVIQTQLNSSTSAELAELQGVSQSSYSEINPLHLPEVLALVSHHHDLGELYVGLKSSIAGVISTINRKECLKQQRAEHEAEIAEQWAIIAQQNAIIAQHRAIIAQHKTRVESIEAEIATIEEADGSHIRCEPRRSKRLRAS